jgi:hypothetical protein
MGKNIIDKVIKKIAKKMSFSTSGEVKGVVENFDGVELYMGKIKKDFENELKKDFGVDEIEVKSDDYYINKKYVTRVTYSIKGDGQDLFLEIEPQELEYNFELEYFPESGKDKKTFKASKTIKTTKKFTLDLSKCYNGGMELPKLHIDENEAEFYRH